MKMPLLGDMPVALVTGEPSPQFIAVGPTDVYFAEYPNGLFKVPIAGGSMTDVATGTDVAQVRNLLTDANNLYWTTTTDGGSINKIAHGGSAVTSVQTGLHGAVSPGYTALSGSFLYFPHGVLPAVSEVAKVSTSGGSVMTVAEVEASIVTADATGVYVVDNKDLTILKLNLDNTITPLAKEPSSQIYRIKVHGNELFWWNAAGALRVTSTTP